MDAGGSPAEHAFHANRWRDSFHFLQVTSMFHTSIEPRAMLSSSTDRLFAFGEQPMRFPLHLDLCRDQVPETDDCDALRFAAALRKLASPDAFRPAFATGDWRVLSSFCIARRLPADYRLVIPGRTDRTLRFVVEGSLWQEGAASQGKLLLPGTILGEDTFFTDGSDAQAVRTLEDCVVLELSLPRHKELTAACPEIGFELLRAAGAVIAARGRSAGRQALATN